MFSMTGYGQAQCRTEEAQVSVEVKTLNGRYLDIVLRVPRELSETEAMLRKVLQGRLRRGRVEVYVNLTPLSRVLVDINEPLLENYRQLLEKIRRLGIEGQCDLAAVLSLPGLLVPHPMEGATQVLHAALEGALKEALEAVIRIRRSEGDALKSELEERLTRLERCVQEITDLAGKSTEHFREKLAQKLSELLQNTAIDQNRLLQEVIFYSERSDITEELTRMRSHLHHFRQYMEEAEKEPVGRNLDFICQEMNREMNTVLSKAPLPSLSELAMEGKAEVERIREQVQNVE